MPNRPALKILLLAGTAEAASLDAALSGDPRFQVTVALAGVTASARPFHGAVRRGGFGGTEGLMAYLRDAGIDLVINATHPFAARMTEQVRAATAALAVPMLRLCRMAWQRPDNAEWSSADDLPHAAALLPPDSVAFLALGQRHLAAFQDHPARLIVRSIDPPPPGLLPAAHWIIGAPGQTVDVEVALLRDLGVTHLVARNSGGAAGWPKIAAATRLELPVIMISRPGGASSEMVTTASNALAWLHQQAARQ
ncbi:MAG: precorrin-6A/cobalt-precorrin-6A reductase [Minwuia sp.]|nr:precorrin-6A/cobalt-precorrin-6A reductase [Minwuia sp.]